MKNPKSKIQTGFTLIELLVAMTIFSIIMLIVSSVVVSAFNLQRRANNLQQSQENGSFLMERMLKEIRVATLPPEVYETCPGSPLTELTIIHPVNGEVTYYLSDKKLYRRVKDKDDSQISSDTVEFLKLGFCIAGVETIPHRQPRVTIIAQIQSAKTHEQSFINIQTTASLRALNE